MASFHTSWFFFALLLLGFWFQCWRTGWLKNWEKIRTAESTMKYLIIFLVLLNLTQQMLQTTISGTIIQNKNHHNYLLLRQRQETSRHLMFVANIITNKITNRSNKKQELQKCRCWKKLQKLSWHYWNERKQSFTTLNTELQNAPRMDFQPLFHKQTKKVSKTVNIM